MLILVSCHGGFPGDYHTHVLITRRPMCKPKDRHKPGIKISLRSSAHTSLGPCRHMALTHLKPEHYTSTWVPNTSPLSSLSRDVIAKHQEAITSGPTAPGSHGFPGHDTLHRLTTPCHCLLNETLQNRPPKADQTGRSPGPRGDPPPRTITGGPDAIATRQPTGTGESRRSDEKCLKILGHLVTRSQDHFFEKRKKFNRQFGSPKFLGAPRWDVVPGYLYPFDTQYYTTSINYWCGHVH